MRELGEEPVLVDLDPGASLTENAGLIADGNHARDFLDGGGSLDELTAQTVEGIPLVPGTATLLNLIGAECFRPSMMSKRASYCLLVGASINNAEG
jgi:cellulose biosynthesis protein BcsQ